MSYRPEIFGIKTYVDESSQKGIDNLNAGAMSALPNGENPNDSPYRSSPAHTRRRERALPLPTGHPEGRDKKSLPAPGAFLMPSDSSNNGDKPVHQRARTQPKEGELYGHPYINQGTLLNQRRTMTASEESILENVLNRYASEIEAGIYPTFKERQRPQMGRAKTYDQRYYRRHKAKKKRRAKMRHRRNKVRGIYKLDRKRRNDKPERYERRKAMGYRTIAERSKASREKAKQNKRASEVVADRWLNKTADFLIERGPAHRWESLLDYNEQESLPQGEHTDYGLPSQYAPIVRGTTPTNRDDVMPTQGFTAPAVYNNPGSAKVIPSGHGFVNKTATKKETAFLEYKKEFLALNKGKAKYKSRAGNAVTWITAYNQKDQKAIEDFHKYIRSKSARKINKISGAGQKVVAKASAIAKGIMGAIKKVAGVAKSEVAGMVKTPKVLFDMATGNYDFSDKKKLKDDSKMIWGSLVYYGGIALAVASGGVSTAAVALGKSVATHATIGAVSADADFMGFLSLEAGETIAGFAGKGAEFTDAMGGFVSTDLFDGVVSGVQTALSYVVATGKSKPKTPEAHMEKVLTKYLQKVGKVASELTDKEKVKILRNTVRG